MTDLADLTARTQALLAGDRITSPTRAVLRARLDRRYDAPRVFDTGQMQTLKAAAARLIPAPDLAAVVDLAAALDATLATGEGDGWRYADAPPDRELHRRGLDALDAASRLRFAAGFYELGPERQDELLAAAASGTLDGAEFDPARWFEELLVALVELHYAHPLVQVQIGYDGMTDAGGVQAVGLAEVAAEARRAG